MAEATVSDRVADDEAVQPLFEGADWSFKLMSRTYDAIEEVAVADLGLDVFPNQVEIISTEQMLDAYSAMGMPLMYRHWSFGKRFAREEKMYRQGHTGLAYEIVINSNPCISYNLEDNSMPLQALVMAHAAFGHNHFFKNNYLFRQWTDADGVLDYFQYAKAYIAKCEERHGLAEVEAVLDAAHAIMDQGVFRYRRAPELTTAEREARKREIEAYRERTFNDLWRTVPDNGAGEEADEAELARRRRRRDLKLPEENLLFFLEHNSPILEGWQREILAIVRNVAQYFYPQRQTKMMNEGCATFVHHYIMNELYDRGLLTEGALLEILHSHSNVIFQPEFDDPRYHGINPYALGFAMMGDIRRICTEPSDEDREWFPDLAGCGDWRGALREAWANYRDESFIRQYLSPELIRRLRLFDLTDDAKESHYSVGAIHDEQGYRKVREALANSYDPAFTEPDIQVVDTDLRGDRQLYLEHGVRDGIVLAEEPRQEVLKHLRTLWGYDVTLAGVDRENGKTLYTTSTAEGDED
ncbi:MAG: SpoVR family protein [Alphaproteobacteria bacterium]|nr:SpoVR family protein [Alphaproteobacteria bacterium]